MSRRGDLVDIKPSHTTFDGRLNASGVCQAAAPSELAAPFPPSPSCRPHFESATFPLRSLHTVKVAAATTTLLLLPPPPPSPPPPPPPPRRRRRSGRIYLLSLRFSRSVASRLVLSARKRNRDSFSASLSLSPPLPLFISLSRALFRSSRTHPLAPPPDAAVRVSRVPDPPAD